MPFGEIVPLGSVKTIAARRAPSAATEALSAHGGGLGLPGTRKSMLAVQSAAIGAETVHVWLLPQGSIWIVVAVMDDLFVSVVHVGEDDGLIAE